MCLTINYGTVLPGEDTELKEDGNGNKDDRACKLVRYRYTHTQNTFRNILIKVTNEILSSFKTVKRRLIGIITF